MSIYWSIDSWGNEMPPENADEIISEANAKITEYAEANPEADESEIAAYSEKLWDAYCEA